jgi:aromatic-L-amino-acid decarboxylase
MAQEFAQWVSSSDNFYMVAPAPLNLVCFRYRGDDEFNKTLLETINKSGKMFFSHTVVNGQYVLRMCIGQTYTLQNHVEQAWQLIQETAKKLAGQKE